MAGVSTGVSLLTVGLVEALVNYWEFTGGSINAYKGNGGSPVTTNVTAITGVDGVSNDALSISAGLESKVRLTMDNANPSGEITLVCFAQLGDAHILRWGNVTGATSSTNFSGNGYRQRNTGGTNVYQIVSQTSPFVFTIPSFTPSSGNNSLGSFYVINVKNNTYPSQTISIYSGSGSLISQSTQNFGLITNTSQVGLETTHYGSLSLSSKLDKLCVYNRNLTASEISYLYNSGSGRSITEILGTVP